MTKLLSNQEMAQFLAAFAGGLIKIHDPAFLPQIIAKSHAEVIPLMNKRYGIKLPADSMNPYSYMYQLCVGLDKFKNSKPKRRSALPKVRNKK